ncbi:MAG: murein biosynthesis integral membrane protein MurJ [Panacagrimonas sp.]
MVSLMTFLSRILGFVRDVLFAGVFGAGSGMDAFLVALKIPNFGRRMFAEGAFSQAFVPVFSEARKKAPQEEVRDLLDVVSGTLGGVLGLITLIGTLGAPLLIWVFAPGFGADPEKHALGAELLRWTFPYLFFISLTSLAGGVLNTHGRFAVPAMTPIILNLCLIGAVLLDGHSVNALAYAVFAAGVLQLLFQLPWLARIHMLPRPRWAWRDSRVRKIINLMVPIMIGSSVAQISLLLDTVLASFLVDGSVSWLYFADRLMEFPLGIFTLAVATVILPSLSMRHASDSPQDFSNTLDWGLRTMLVIGVPAALGLFLLSGPLISTLFQYREFDAHDLQMTQWALRAYAFGFLGFSLVKVLVPGFYARQETRIPVRYAIIALCCGMAMSLSFLGLALWLDFAAPHAAMALATSLSAAINAGLLLRRLLRDRVLLPRAGWGVFALRVLLANAAMALVLWWVNQPLDWWIAAAMEQRASQLLGVVAAAAASYFLVLWVSGVRLHQFRSPG